MTKWKYGVIIGVVALGAGGYAYNAYSSKKQQPAKLETPRSAPEPLKVATYVVKPAPFVETLAATGTLRADESVDLQVEVSGKVTSINFQEGGPVKKGDLLLKINDSELQAQRTRADFRKQIAELKERRLASLLQGGGVPQQDYDTALNELNVQKAEIALIDAQIAKTEVRAPFDGVIGLRFVSEGAFITATSNAAVRIATLQALDRMKIDFNVPEKYSGRLRIGTPISFSVAGGSSRFKGEVYAIEPRVDVSTRTVLLRAVCVNAKGQLLSGSFASVECELPAVEDAILVPAGAVVPGLTSKTVFVIKDGKAERRTIETGTRTESMVQVMSGLSVGEQVIVSNIQQIRPGLPVQAASPRAGKDGKPPVEAGKDKAPPKEKREGPAKAS
jgi:membrane fusion protein (multidrug efflux system)